LGIFFCKPTGIAQKKPDMKLSESLLLKLSKTYPPSSMVNMKFKGKDLQFKTDEEGNPILLFIGKTTAQGKIAGQRYTRILKRDNRGLLIKDHWDLKGPAT
jgi:hypothetical protein